MQEQKWRVIINRHGMKGRSHEVTVATVSQIVTWFPEISEKLFEHFNVAKMEFAFESDGNLSIYTFHKIENV